MKISRPLLVMRVDRLPPLWYAGQDPAGAPTVTQSRDYAWRFNDLDEARLIVETLKQDVGGVWSIVSDRVLQ